MNEERLDFLSQEWLNRFKELVNGSHEYEKAARDWEGSFIFEVEPEGDVIKKPLRGFVDLWHGKCREVRVANESDTADYTYSGSLENWRKLLAKDLGPIKALMARKFRLKGSMTTVMRYIKAAQILVELATQVPTRLPAE